MRTWFFSFGPASSRPNVEDRSTPTICCPCEALPFSCVSCGQVQAIRPINPQLRSFGTDSGCYDGLLEVPTQVFSWLLGFFVIYRAFY
jgi:hypothetical protein